jgi:hexosaminidase
MLLPKLLGMSERAWAKDPMWANEQDSIKSAQLYQEAWTIFANTVGKKELVMLDYYQQGFKFRIPSVGALVEKGTVKANVQLPGLQIKYTVDGSEPTIESKTYIGPISERGLIKLKVFSANGRSGRTTSIANN